MVLILQVRAVAPAHHLNCEHVCDASRIGSARATVRAAPRDGGGDVKLARKARVLCVAHLDAVYPNRRVRVGAVKLKKHAPAIPLGRKLKRALVRTDRIVVARHRKVPELRSQLSARDRVAVIAVDRLILHLRIELPV